MGGKKQRFQVKKYLLVGVALLFIATVAFQFPEPEKDKINQTKRYPEFALKLLELHNKERVYWGYKPLEIDANLCEYAQDHAEKMANGKGLKHSSMSELQKASGAGLVGENIAWGQETEVDVVNAWMWSPGHRWNILGSGYEKVGFGISKDKNDRNYWCVVFSD